MTIEAITTLFFTIVALSLKPGPGMMMVMSRTIAHEMPACVAFVAGWSSVLFLYLVIVFISFNVVNFDMVFLLLLIKVGAAAYLIYLGVKGLQEADVAFEKTDIPEESLFNSFLAGVVLTLSNPLAIVFYAGILPSLLDMSAMTYDDMVIIVAVVLGVVGVLPIIYCAPLALYRKKIPVSFFKGLRIFSSVVIIIVGLYIGYTAIPAADILSVF